MPWTDFLFMSSNIPLVDEDQDFAEQLRRFRSRNNAINQVHPRGQ